VSHADAARSPSDLAAISSVDLGANAYVDQAAVPRASDVSSDREIGRGGGAPCVITGFSPSVVSLERTF